jgi:hypothetical protein
MAGKRNKSAGTEVQGDVEHLSANGAWSGPGSQDMPPKRRNTPTGPAPSVDWRLLMSGNQLGILSILISAVTILYSAGWIPGIAKQTDVSTLANQIVEIRKSVDNLIGEFSATRLELIKATASIARIEGRLEAQPQISEAAARPVRKPVRPKEPVKPVAQGWFN